MSSCHYSMIRVFQCEDTLTGILTGVYDAWASRLGHEHVRLRSGEYEDLELFCEYTEVAPDLTKAGKVLRTIQTRLGEEAYEMIAYAAAYPHTGKADAIYLMIVVGLHLPDGRKVSGMLTHPDVRLVFELRRKTWHMAHRYMGFVRFREMRNGVLFSRIEAEADILALIAPHFADRLPLEDWAIYDGRCRKAAVHPAGKGWVILEEAEEAFSGLQESEEEPYFDRLWKIFHRAVGIESRTNDRLQMSFLPKKFRLFMNEFADGSEEEKVCHNFEIM